ncbi:MAG: hypothetical protein ABS81_02770 [Pseudonocardia sp. SCN 72-86]|nr:MAG: hypothetical protein ABS81_02770 [Pseudonocardia sp. SCN 72-86]
MTLPKPDGVDTPSVPVRRRRRVEGLRWSLLALVIAALVLWPILRLEAKAFDDGASSFGRALAVPDIGQVLGYTLGLALGSVAIAVVLGVGLAWCTTRLPPRVAGVVAILPIIPLMVPSVASIAGWTYLLSPRTGMVNRLLRSIGLGSGATGPIDVYTLPWIIILTGFSLTSFVYLFVHASLRQRGAELEIAAAAAGATPWRVFRTITLPLLRPAIVYSTGITFLLGLGQFAAPLLLGGPQHIDVVTTLMFRLTADYPVDYALGAALATPLLLAGLAVVLLQRRALRDERRFVSVAGKSRYVAGRTSWWALAPILAYVTVAIVLPVFALVVVSFSPFWSGRIQPETFSVANWAAAFADTKVVAAIGTSVTAIGVAVVIVLPLGYLAAVALLHRTRMPAVIRATIDLLGNLSLSLPAALFGFAFLFTYTVEPFKLYGTTAMIVVAYVTLMIPYAIRPQLSSMLTTGGEYVEASRASGAGFVRTSLRISLPMIRTGLGVSAALIVVMLVHEFAASVMVTSANTQVLGSLLYATWSSGTSPEVAVIALVMVVVTSLGVGLAVLLGGSKALEQM